MCKSTSLSTLSKNVAILLPGDETFGADYPMRPVFHVRLQSFPFMQVPLTTTREAKTTRCMGDWLAKALLCSNGSLYDKGHSCLILLVYTLKICRTPLHPKTSSVLVVRALAKHASGTLFHVNQPMNTVHQD
jgi:hypothetical protein